MAYSRIPFLHSAGTSPHRSPLPFAYACPSPESPGVYKWPSQWSLPYLLDLISPLHPTTSSFKLTSPWGSRPLFQPPCNLLESSFPNPFLSTSPCPPLKCCGPQRFLYDRPIIFELDNQESKASAALTDLLHNPLISALLSKPIPEFWPSHPAWTSSRASSRVSLPLVLPALVHCPQCS